MFYEAPPPPPLNESNKEKMEVIGILSKLVVVNSVRTQHPFFINVFVMLFNYHDKGLGDGECWF